MSEPTIDDLYYEDEEMAISGVAQGLLKKASRDDKSYHYIDNGDNTESIFYVSATGTNYFLGKQPIIGEGGFAGPQEPEGLPMGANQGADVGLGEFAAGFGKTMAQLGKGLAVGGPGVVGDLIALVRGAYDVFTMTKDEAAPNQFVYDLLQKNSPKLEKFAAGLSKETGFPTTDDINKEVDKFVPAWLKSKQEGSDLPPMAQTVGEMAAPSTIGKLVKTMAKVGTKEAVAPIASTAALTTMDAGKEGR